MANEVKTKRQRFGIVSEYIYFLRNYKMYWLVPVFVLALILGTLVVMGGSNAALLIYTLF